MTRESIRQFSQDKAEPLWLQERRLAAFDKIDNLPLPTIERVKFHRWNFGDGTLSETEELAAVPDFIALGDNPKLVQVGTQTVLEQLPADLAKQGLVLTDFATTLEQIPELIEAHFGTAVSFDQDKLAAYHTAYFNSAAVLYVPDGLEVQEPIEMVFLQDSSSDVPLNKHVLIIAGKNSRFSYLERFETIGQGTCASTTI